MRKVPPPMGRQVAELERETGVGRGVARRAAWTGGASLGDWRLRLSSRFSWTEPDVLALSALLLLTAAFGRPFSKIGIGDTLFISEVLLVAALGFLLLRIGLPAAWGALRARLPIVPLAVFWLLGSIAAVRGLEAYGLSMVIEDVGLLEYSVLLPLVVLIARDRRRLRMLGVAVLIGAVACTALLLVSSVGQRAGFELPITVLGPAGASGLYISFFVIWVGARALHGVAVPPWQLSVAGLGLLLMWATNTRTVWLVLAACAVVLIATSPRARLPLRGLAVVASLVGTFAVFYAVDEFFPVKTAAKPQVEREISGLVGGTSTEGSNVEWRIAYWKELGRRAATDPEIATIGAGLGTPIAFTWNGRKYDFRDGDPGAFGGDVMGPHNSFLNVMYRMGAPALLALLVLIAAAVARAGPLLRRGRLSMPRRAELVGIVGALTSAIAVAGFNEALKGPFLGVFFWVALGLLFAYTAIERDQAGSESRPATAA